MIREALKVGTQYAVLHPSMQDRTKARPFEVTAIPAHGSDVVGWYTDQDVIEGAHVSVRLIRGTWADWQAGTEPQRQHYRHKNPAGWLRRIADHPDASAALREAALDQLSTLTTTTGGTTP